MTTFSVHHYFTKSKIWLSPHTDADNFSEPPMITTWDDNRISNFEILVHFPVCIKIRPQWWFLSAFETEHNFTERDKWFNGLYLKICCSIKLTFLLRKIDQNLIQQITNCDSATVYFHQFSRKISDASAFYLGYFYLNLVPLTSLNLLIDLCNLSDSSGFGDSI